MRAFADLYEAIDGTTSTTAKVRAMAAFFRAAGGESAPGGSEVPAADGAWAVYFLTGRKIKRLISGPALARWAMERAGVPGWLFDECYASVGDLAETIALILDSRVDARAEVRGTQQGTAGAGEVRVAESAPPRAQRPRAAQLSLFAPPARQSTPASVEAAGASAGEAEDLSLRDWIEERVLPLRGLDEAEQRERVLAWWDALPMREVFLLVKVITGELRVGVSQILVVKALSLATRPEGAEHNGEAGVPEDVMAHRLSGSWEPTPAFFRGLLAPMRGVTSAADDDARAAAGALAAGEFSRPYPFFLASPLEGLPADLGPRGEWLAEWKWDGIRAQVIRRAGVQVWSRGEELITERFPEIVEAATRLPPGTVLDGEVLAWREGRPLGFAALQTRIGRLDVSRKALRTAPAAFVAYDLLEEGGRDVRELTLRERRARLAALLARGGPADASAREARLILSPEAPGETWEALALARDESRARAVEGVMLKRWDSVYQVGRRKGDWWKWKIDPYSVDAVLVYAQPGHGRRANLLTDYTFAAWDGPDLVPFAKAYSGLDMGEIEELDRWIRQHTTERFGPVRAVAPLHIFELAFEGIQASPRHRSGIALRFPRIARWRRDKRPEEADTLATLRELLRGATEGDQHGR